MEKVDKFTLMEITIHNIPLVKPSGRRQVYRKVWLQEYLLLQRAGLNPTQYRLVFDLWMTSCNMDSNPIVITMDSICSLTGLKIKTVHNSFECLASKSIISIVYDVPSNSNKIIYRTDSYNNKSTDSLLVGHSPPTTRGEVWGRSINGQDLTVQKLDSEKKVGGEEGFAGITLEQFKSVLDRLGFPERRGDDSISSAHALFVVSIRDQKTLDELNHALINYCQNPYEEKFRLSYIGFMKAWRKFL